MTFSIAIRTVARRERMLDALASNFARWLSHPSVLGLHVSAREDVAPNENACIALEGAISDRSDWIIFLEDDAGPISDFIGSVERWMARNEVTSISMYPLGYQYATPEGTESWPYPIKNFYCSVGLVLRRNFAERLIGYLRENRHVRQGFDIMAGHCHRTISSSEVLSAPVPCFVEHLGDESTLAENRPSKNAVGRFQGFPGFGYSYGAGNG